MLEVGIEATAWARTSYLRRVPHCECDPDITSFHQILQKIPSSSDTCWSILRCGIHIGLKIATTWMVQCQSVELPVLWSKIHKTPLLFHIFWTNLVGHLFLLDDLTAYRDFWKINCWTCGCKHLWFGPTFKADSSSDPDLSSLLYQSDRLQPCTHVQVFIFFREQYVIGTRCTTNPQQIKVMDRALAVVTTQTNN